MREVRGRALFVRIGCAGELAGYRANRLTVLTGAMVRRKD